MARYLVTGGAGFFGTILKKALLDRGHAVVSVDLCGDPYEREGFTSWRGDINDDRLMDRVFSGGDGFDGIFHMAALLAHVKKDLPALWKANVDGTANVLKYAERFGVKNLVLASSNCLWARNFDDPVSEEEVPDPVEIYGKSKLEGERILLGSDKVACSVIRCPTIMDEGRLGLLGILFAFIDEDRKLWVVGDGENRYQFIYAKDLVEACTAAIAYPKSTVFNIGSDDVRTFNEVYRYVIDAGKSKSRIVHLPKTPLVWAMKVCFALGISPLGPYQYRMITSNFVFDTSKIKRELGWRPTKTNGEMLLAAYEYYHRNRSEILSRTGVSAHSSVADMGVIRLLKWLS